MKPFRLIQSIFRNTNESRNLKQDARINQLKADLSTAKRMVNRLRKNAFTWVSLGRELPLPGDPGELAPDRPWKPGVRTSPPTMLTPQEQTLLYWSASSYYRGIGEIVDAGCFRGGSTMALATGLRDNLNVSEKERRIHSFDLFLVEGRYKERYFANTELQAGDSFLELFKRDIENCSEFTQIYPGDICTVPWEAPIEILFLDVLKLKDINNHVLSHFFPKLIPGVSLVIQQDYIHFALPWIHVSMERLSEYFEPLDYFRSGSAVFRLKKEIPREVLESGAGTSESADAQIALIDKAIAKVPLESRPFVMLAKVMLLSDNLRNEAAHELLEEIRKTFTEARFTREIGEATNYLKNPWRQRLSKQLSGGD